MSIQNNNEQYLSLRNKYPVFSYDSYTYKIENKDLLVKFQFSIGNEIRFSPESKLKYHPSFDAFYVNNDLSDLNAFVFSIGMIELISYWKATCSPLIHIHAGGLAEEALAFWKKLYYHGLGEFFYRNSIETDYNSFVDIVRWEDYTKCTKRGFPVFGLKDENIIPLGGGKDSIVTLELLRSFDVVPMVINPRGATLETLRTGGFEHDFLRIERKIDPLLLELNQQGFLNGHTPFSAMLAFYSILASVVSGKKNIVLSNESSANEPTVIGSDVNHQYSKSYEFESDFRTYVANYLSEEVNYYSFLRPLSELQIACLFSTQQQYFPVFKSCNVGSKEDVWCCHCAKCLFTFIILSPFIPPEQLIRIFGENLLEKKSLLPVFGELCGLTKEKPFECVGTIDEVCLALVEAMKHYETLPFLLQHFITTPLYQQYRHTKFKRQLCTLNARHFLPEKAFKILKEHLNLLIEY
ncbi:MAG: hypothetical protein LBI60_05950 [Bacteroidales bacterium]|jgi:hypothetical protein|nr:hypothetical protein [Bacteroidales bacterium]